jgi:hypothetical protein
MLGPPINHYSILDPKSHSVIKAANRRQNAGDLPAKT